MAKLSRRNMLILGAAGAGEIGALAAAAAAGAHFDSTSALASTTRSLTTPRIDISQEPLAAFVPDAKGDTIVIMRGEQEIAIVNSELVRTLLSLSSSF